MVQPQLRKILDPPMKIGHSLTTFGNYLQELTCLVHLDPHAAVFIAAKKSQLTAGLARVGQFPIPIDYGQPLFLWLLRD